MFIYYFSLRVCNIYILVRPSRKVNMKEVCSAVGFVGRTKSDLESSKGSMRAGESVLDSGRSHRVGWELVES